MKFSFTKNPESEFFIKNPNLTKKNSGGWEGRGRGCGWGVIIIIFFEGVKVWEYWLVYVNLFNKESKSFFVYLFYYFFKYFFIFNIFFT